MDDRYPINCHGLGCGKINCLHCGDYVIARVMAGLDYEWERFEPYYLDSDIDPTDKM